MTIVPEDLGGTLSTLQITIQPARSLLSFLTSHSSTTLARKKTSPWPDFTALAFSHNSYFGDNSYHSTLCSQSFLTLPFLNSYLSVVTCISNSPLLFKHLLSISICKADQAKKIYYTRHGLCTQRSSNLDEETEGTT